MARRFENQKSKLEDTSPMSSTEAVAEHSGVSVEDVTGPQELSFSDRQVPLTRSLGNLTSEDISCDVGNIQEPLITMTGPTRPSSTVVAVTTQSSLLPVARPSQAACESVEVPAQPDVGRTEQFGFISTTASSSPYEIKEAKVFPSTRGGLGSVTRNTHVTSRPNLRPSRRPTAQEAPQGSSRANPTARKAPQGSGRANPTARKAPQGSGRAKPTARKAPQGSGRAKPTAQKAPQGSGRAKPTVRKAPQGSGRANPSGREAPQGFGQANPTGWEARQASGWPNPTGQVAPQGSGQANPTGWEARQASGWPNPTGQVAPQGSGQANPTDWVAPQGSGWPNPTGRVAPQGSGQANPTGWEARQASGWPNPTGQVAPQGSGQANPTDWVAPQGSGWPNPTGRVAPQGSGQANPTGREAPQGSGQANPTGWVASQASGWPNPTGQVAPQGSGQANPTDWVAPQGSGWPNPTGRVAPQGSGQANPTGWEARQASGWPNPTGQVAPQGSGQANPTDWVAPQGSGWPNPTGRVAPQGSGQANPTGREAPQGSGQANPTGWVASQGSGWPNPTGRVAPQGSGQANPTGQVAPQGSGQANPTGREAPQGSGWPNPTGQVAPQGSGQANPPGWGALQGSAWANPIDWKASQDPILINPATLGTSQRPDEASWNVSTQNILINSRERIGLFLRKEEHGFCQERSQINTQWHYQFRFPMKKGSLITIFSLTEAGLLKAGEQLYVCEKFLMGTCQNDSSCHSYHTLLPFHWQFHHKDDNCWYSVPLGTQMHLEMIHANPNNKAAKIVYFGKTLYLDMYLKKFQSSLPSCFDYARRICCKSDSPFASSYRVFWHDGDKWISYDQESGNPFISQQNLYGTRVKLEEMYLLKTSRPIYAPLYQNLEKLRIWHFEKSNTLWGEDASIVYLGNHPYEHQMTMAPGDYFTVMEISPSEPAYQYCCQFFHNSIPPDQAVVLRIYRYYNPYFWFLYQREKRRLKNLRIPGAQECHLFCQTPFSLEDLTMNGLCPKKGSIDGILGRGLYFSPNTSVLTSRKTINSGYMTVLAKVLIGERTLGNYSFYSPPRKENGQEYDACVNNMNMPTLFTVFQRDLTYPYFIIFFKCAEDTVHLVY